MALPSNAAVLIAAAASVARSLTKLASAPSAAARRIGPLLDLVIKLGGLFPVAQRQPEQPAVGHDETSAWGSSMEAAEWDEDAFQEAAEEEVGEAAIGSSHAGELVDRPERILVDGVGSIPEGATGGSEDWDEDGSQDAAEEEVGDAGVKSSRAGELIDSQERILADDGVGGAPEGAAGGSEELLDEPSQGPQGDPLELSEDIGAAGGSEDWDEDGFQDAASPGVVPLSEEPLDAPSQGPHGDSLVSSEDIGAASQHDQRAASEPQARRQGDGAAADEAESLADERALASPAEEGAAEEPAGHGEMPDAEVLEAGKSDDAKSERSDAKASNSRDGSKNGDSGTVDASPEAMQQEDSWQDGDGKAVSQAEQQLQAAQELCLQVKSWKLLILGSFAFVE